MGYNERLGDKLHKEDLQRFVRKNPSTKKVKLAPRNYGSDNIREKRRADAGTIDFHHYGGKKSKETKWEEMISGAKYWNKKNGKGKGDRTRKDWQKVAKELGIDNVDSEEKVLRMIEHVRGGRLNQKEEETVNPPSEPPATFTPSPAHEEARTDFEEKQNNPVPRMSDQPGLAGGTSDPMADAIRHGDDLNDWYQRETEVRKAEAKLGAYEIGERTRFNANRFVGKVPELGDVGKLVENYSKDFK